MTNIPKAAVSGAVRNSFARFSGDNDQEFPESIGGARRERERRSRNGDEVKSRNAANDAHNE